MLDLSVPHVEEAQIQIDALATDPAWDGALVLDDFTAFDPVPGAAPTGRTTVRVVSDRDHLYLHFSAEDPEPDRVRARIGRRDTRFGDDFVGLYLDPAGDGQRAWLFAANALGIQLDGIRVEASGQDDISWDGRWLSAGRRTDAGYEVELAIPWRTVRHPTTVDELGLFFFRSIPRVGEKSAWPALDPEVNGVLVQEALIQGPGALPATAGVDAIGELAFGWTETGPVNHRLGWNGLFPGLTLRYTPGPSTSLGATVNPDFSQVESDGAVIDVNRRYALYQDEKRPFFQEGSEWYDHPFGELVYTRSMVTPLVGARGTTEQGPVAIAAVSVLDSEPSPPVSEGGGWTEDQLEGRHALETAARARLQVGDDGHVGLIATDRAVLGTDLHNTVAGADARLRLTDQLTVDGSLLGSATVFEEGGELRIAPAASARISWNTERYSAGSWVRAVAPDFRAENGFVTSADQLGGGSWAGVTLRPGWSWLPRVTLNPLNAWYGWTTSGQLRHAGVMPNARFKFGNGAWAWAGVRQSGEEFCDKWLPSRRISVEAGGTWTKWLELSAGGSTGTAPWYDSEAPATGVKHSAWVSAGLAPIPLASLTLSGGWERFDLHGDTAYSGWVGRARLDVNATRNLSGRLLLDYNSFDGRRSADALIAWEQAPGRALYLGGRVDPGAPGTDDPLSWQVQAKASWTLSR